MDSLNNGEHRDNALPQSYDLEAVEAIDKLLREVQEGNPGQTLRDGPMEPSQEGRSTGALERSSPGRHISSKALRPGGDQHPAQNGDLLSQVASLTVTVSKEREARIVAESQMQRADGERQAALQAITKAAETVVELTKCIHAEHADGTISALSPEAMKKRLRQVEDTLWDTRRIILQSTPITVSVPSVAIKTTHGETVRVSEQDFGGMATQQIPLPNTPPTGTAPPSGVLAAISSPALPAAPQPASFPWNRFIRWSCGGAAVAVIAVGFVIPKLVPTSETAGVTADITTIRSPIDGTWSVKPSIYDVASGADIGIVENPRVDTSRLDSLESRRATATEDLSNAKRDVIRSEDDIRRLDAEISKARRSMLDMAETEKVGLDADVLANESDFDASSSEYERLLQVQQAQNNGSISRRDLDRARGDRDRARGKLERSKSDQRRLAMKIEALRAGLFPDGDQPMEIGFIAQEKSRLADRQARVTQIETDIKGLDNDIVLERERVEKLRKASITAPTSGIIWRRSAAPGQSVRNGDELCSVAQDGTIRVEAWVNPSHSSSMSVGDGALVRVVGSEIPREGVVEEILPPGAYRAGSERAWQPAIKNDRLIRVVIKVDGMEGRIGNHASVMVTGQNPGILKRWAHALVQWSSW